MNRREFACYAGLVALLLAFTSPISSANGEAMNAGSDAPIESPWDMMALSEPPQLFDAPGFEAEGVQALFYEGRPFDGNPTRVFAWYGAPRHEPGEKLPAMVLVHGGGGTAYAEWVRLWNEHGYAAIAMDLCGHVPKSGRTPHEQGGPPGWGGFEQIDWPLPDQWTYHGVADIILAHSLIRSFPEVDPDRIGVMGVSWGGYLTCIVAGLDQRFQFAISFYLGGYMTTGSKFIGSFEKMGPEKTAKWYQHWDPANYLANATMPMLWMTRPFDGHEFWAFQKSYRLAPGPRTVAVPVDLGHGHSHAWPRPEPYAFADSLTKNGAPLAKITAQGEYGGRAWATFESQSPIVKAELNYTTDLGLWRKRKWHTVAAEVDQPSRRASAEIPQGATACYLNLFDERGLISSSEHLELVSGEPN